MTDNEALARIDTHEKVCAERYGNIWSKLNSIEIQFATVHTRFNTISNRMWSAVAGVCAAAVLGLCVVVFHLLTKGH